MNSVCCKVIGCSPFFVSKHFFSLLIPMVFVSATFVKPNKPSSSMKFTRTFIIISPLMRCSYFLDKAFDKVSHGDLLLKLSCLNFDTTLIDWIREFLTDRRQFVAAASLPSLVCTPAILRILYRALYSYQFILTTCHSTFVLTLKILLFNASDTTQYLTHSVL